MAGRWGQRVFQEKFRSLEDHGSIFKSLKKLTFTIIIKKYYSNKFSKKPLIFFDISKFS